MLIWFVLPFTASALVIVSATILTTAMGTFWRCKAFAENVTGNNRDSALLNG
jgi:hypothetical protein